MSIKIRQIELIAGICELLDQQHPELKATTRQTNAVIQAADLIVAAFKTDDVQASDDIGLDAWLKTDSAGASSRFMAMYLSGRGASNTDVPHPYDPSDFGRCRILLKAVPHLAPKLSLIAEASGTWASLVEHWDEISRLMDEEAPEWRETGGSATQAYELMKAIGC